VLSCRCVDAPPDPQAIARLFEASGDAHVAWLHASERSSDPLSRFSYVASGPDLESEKLDPLADDPELREGGAGGLEPAPPALFGRVPRWIGVLPYESRRALERPGWAPIDTRPRALIERPAWRRYRAVVCVDHEEGRVFAVGMTRADADALAGRLARANARGELAARGAGSDKLRVETADGEPLGLHIERIRAAKELIARGDLYQVNLARRIRVAIREGSALSLYERLARAAPSPFGAYLRLADGVTVLSTSPELFLCAYAAPAAGSRLRFGSLLTVPIKGTRPRGADAAADEALVRELDADPKERAELTMIIDVERNDLGRVAEVGSVRMTEGPRVVTHRTVHHRQAAITARARADASREDVLLAMLPSGSVTGAPKVRAMEVIARLEPSRRGLYTGAFGFVAHDGGVTLAMGIRTVVLAGREGEYLTGGGIVADSDPERELEETRWKALQLERAATGPATNWSPQRRVG
jgi:anthranilate/para-aminobenzoate synthase component I